MSRPNESGKPTKTVACEISVSDHMKIKTIAQLRGKSVRDLVAELLVGHDLGLMVREALNAAMPEAS